MFSSCLFYWSRNYYRNKTQQTYHRSLEYCASQLYPSPAPQIMRQSSMLFFLGFDFFPPRSFVKKTTNSQNSRIDIIGTTAHFQLKAPPLKSFPWTVDPWINVWNLKTPIYKCSRNFRFFDKGTEQVSSSLWGDKRQGPIHFLFLFSFTTQHYFQRYRRRIEINQG